MSDSPPDMKAPGSLKGLTEAQRQGVLQTEGPVLILAGPGSGKTRVITRRIAYLVECGIPAWQILALTFTNKAANEMRERVISLLGEGAITRGLTVTTFHALCARLLRKYLDPVKGLAADAGVGITSTFAIGDTADQTALMKKTIELLHLSTSNWQPRSILGVISAAKNELITPAEYSKQAMDFNSRTIAKIYSAYDKAMRAANMVDFDDLLMLTVRLLTRSAAARQDCRRRWQYLLIDEYQDTNRAQFKIASLLAGGAGESADAAAAAPNICVVGDPDQSIYGWRGADISNILDFEKMYPGAHVITLGENFRSTGEILAAADSVIRHNTLRKHKPLFTSRPAGHKPEAVLTQDEHDEAALVLDWIREVKEQAADRGSDADLAAISWKDFAIFYRTNALSRVMEDTLRNAGVPYVIARGTAFYQREEIKHALAYLRVVANPADSISLARIVNTPARGISDATWERIERAAMDSGLAEIEAMRLAAEGHVPRAMNELNARAIAAVGRFVQLINDWTGAGRFMGAAAPASLAELVERVIRESGLEKMYRDAKDGPDEDRLENLSELISSAREFEMGYDPGADPAADFDVVRADAAGVPMASTIADDIPSEPGGPVIDPDDPLGGLAPDASGADAFSLDEDGSIFERDEPHGAGPEHGARSPLPGVGRGAGNPAAPPLLAMLRAYLERVTLVADADTVDPSQGAVTLMTLHAAKGLEFRAVAMIGLEEGTLPHARAVYGGGIGAAGSPSQADLELEEERRLCFVGMTRAMERLILTSARYRTIRGVPERCMRSRFLDEIEPAHVIECDRAGEADRAWADRTRGDRRDAPDRSRAGNSAASALRRDYPDDTPGAGGLRVGMMVRHPQFGVGKVTSLTRGIDARAKVVFRDVGERTLVLQYARLTKVE
ncbi:MAG: ATP-dependent helicase [Phycisphaerales bacterium]